MKTKKTKIELLLDFSAAKFEVPAEDIQGRSRVSNIQEARLAFCYVAYKNYTGLVIGKLLSGRDESTISCAVKSAQNSIDTNGTFREKVAEINQYYKEISAGNYNNVYSKIRDKQEPLTRILYNQAQTVLHIAVFHKVISSHRFIAYTGSEDFEQEDPCGYCSFKTIKCNCIACCGDERKDKKTAIM